MIRRLVIAGALILLGATLAVGFLAYRQPELLFDTVNLRYCG